MRFKSILIMIFLSANLSAADRQDFEDKLIASCSEAVSLFKSSDREDQKKLRLSINQSFATSNTEALQMGYCKGVIDAMMQLRPHCRYEHWFPIAERLVEQKQSNRKVIEFIRNEC